MTYTVTIRITVEARDPAHAEQTVTEILDEYKEVVRYDVDSTWEGE